MSINFKVYIVANKTKGGVLKTGVSRNQNMPYFTKNEHFFPWYCTRACAYQGKKCSFFGKFDVLCFLVTRVLRFALLALLPTMSHGYPVCKFELSIPQVEFNRTKLNICNIKWNLVVLLSQHIAFSNSHPDIALILTVFLQKIKNFELLFHFFENFPFSRRDWKGIFDTM